MSYIFRCAKHIPSGKIYLDWRLGKASTFRSVRSLIDWATSNMNVKKSKTKFASFAVTTQYDDWVMFVVDDLTKDQVVTTKNKLMLLVPIDLLLNKNKA
jgi:hypothetical protein